MSSIWTAVIEGMVRRRVTALIIVMAVMSVWAYFHDFSPRVTTEEASATIMEVKKTGWHVELETGETVWIYAAPEVTAKQGDTVPVIISTYESGKRRVEFDKEKWMFGG